MKKLLVLMLVLVLCMTGISAAMGESLEKVNFLLNWTIAADHAPYFVALKNGWYEEAGLDLNVIIGKGSGFSVTSIDTEMADIAISDAPVVFKFRQDGAKVKIIGIIFDKHPNSMLFFDDSGIKQPSDIVGKTVAVPATDGHKVMWPAFAAMIGADPESVEFVNIEPTAKVSALASRNADVVFELKTGTPNFEAAIPEGGFSSFLWADYGFECYAHSYITSDKTIQERPEMLKKFLDVTYRAWEWTVNNPAEAIQILSEYQPINTADLEKSLDIEMDFLKTERYKEHGMGYIDPAQIQATYDLVSTYQEKLDYPVEEIYDASFLPATHYNNFEME